MKVVPLPAGSPTPVRHDIADREDVDVLVRSFYRLAAQDDLLGPVFAAAGVDWPSHIDRLTDFWCWQLLGQAGYGRNPLRAHASAHARTPFSPAHHQRWESLFCDTVDEHFAGPVADAAKVRGLKMSRALARLLDGASAPGDEPVRQVEAVLSRRPSA